MFRVEQPDEYVPSFSFIKGDGTEIQLKPGDIFGLFRSRMNDLDALKKPLQYSKMLPWAVAYYEALCIYHRRELDLIDFGFSSKRKQVVFDVIRAAAVMEIESATAGYATSRTHKPKFSRRAPAATRSINDLRQKARKVS